MGKRALDFVVIAACAAFFLHWCLDGLSHQGLYTDVALYGDLALGVYKRVPFDGWEFLRAGPYSIPLTVKEFHGPIPIYAVLPWIYALGNKAIALNLPPVVLSALCLPLIYALALMLFESRWAAVAATLCMATTPAWIGATRVGLYTGTMDLFLELGSMLLFVLWKRRGRFALAAAGCLFLGLGLGSHTFFAWYALALAAYALLFERAGMREMFRGGKRTLACGAAASIGLLPMIIANVKGRFVTLRFLASHVVVSYGGYSNLDYAEHLKLRFAQLTSLLDASILTGRSDNGWLSWLFWACLFAAAIEAAESLAKRRAPHRRSAFWSFMFLCMLILSPITPTGLGPHHLLVLFPFVCLGVADVATRAGSAALATRAMAVCAILAVALAVNSRLLYVRRVHQMLHGGREVKWNAMADVVSWLRDHHADRIGLGDTGMMDPINYLSGREIEEKEIFWAPYVQTPREIVIASLRERLGSEHSGGYYLFRAPDHYWIPFFSDFAQVVAQEHKRIVARQTFSDPDDGTLIFVLYFVR